MLIKNSEELITSKERRIVLDMIEVGLLAIQPPHVIPQKVSLINNVLTIAKHEFNLNSFQNIYLIGFGKGSAAISFELEKILGGKLSEGYVIDVTDAPFSKINFTTGTHPLPSQENFLFTEKIIQRFENQLNLNDLVLIVICGGGSAMLVAPSTTLEQKIEVNSALLKSGAEISEMNIVRKHLSKVKGGGLAKLLSPAKVATLIFSDVPGNDLSTISSGPTVLDKTKKEDAWKIVTKYNLQNLIKMSDLIETPKEEEYFANVSNQIILSNKTALIAMEQKANSLGYKAFIYSDCLKGEAKLIGKELIEKTDSETILLAGGETIVKAQGNGEGGRNQEVILGALDYLKNNVVIASFDSDGWDNSFYAGAIADKNTLAKANSLNLDPEVYLNNNNSLEFFQKVGDGIETERLPANVSDLFIVFCP